MSAGDRIYRWGHGRSKEIVIRTSVVKGGPYLLVCFERVDIINGIGAEKIVCSENNVGDCKATKRTAG